MKSFRQPRGSPEERRSTAKRKRRSIRRTSALAIGLSYVSPPAQVTTVHVGSLIVSIHDLKSWAMQNLPLQSKVRTVILAEREVMTAEEFVSKVETWSLLMNTEDDQTKSAERDPSF